MWFDPTRPESFCWIVVTTRGMPGSRKYNPCCCLPRWPRPRARKLRALPVMASVCGTKNMLNLGRRSEKQQRLSALPGCARGGRETYHFGGSTLLCKPRGNKVGLESCMFPHQLCFHEVCTGKRLVALSGQNCAQRRGFRDATLVAGPAIANGFLGQTKAATFLALFLALLCCCIRCFFSLSSVLLPQISPHYHPSFPLYDAVSFTRCDHALFRVRSRQKGICDYVSFPPPFGAGRG